MLQTFNPFDPQNIPPWHEITFLNASYDLSTH